MFERPNQSGDMVEVGAVSGTVSESACALRPSSYDGAGVVLPNGLLLSGYLSTALCLIAAGGLSLRRARPMGPTWQVNCTVGRHRAWQSPGLSHSRTRSPN